MRRIAPLLLWLLLANPASATDVILTQLPAGITNWTTANSPYVVKPSTGTTLTIPNLATLLIEPGVTVQLRAGVSLVVNSGGTFSANGTSASKIQFAPVLAGTLWGGIRCVSGATLSMNDCELLGFGTFPVEGTIPQVAGLFASNTFVKSGSGTFNAIRLIDGIVDASLELSAPPADFCYITATSTALEVHGAGGPILTIADGTVIKFASGSYLRTGAGPVARPSGCLRANAVLFTSAQDDAAGGGDTNGDGTTTVPAPGQWRNLRFEVNTLSGPGQTSVKNCEVRYAGSTEDAGVLVLNSTPQITGGSFHHNVGSGLRVNGTLAGLGSGISGVTLHDNTKYEVAGVLPAIVTLIPANVIQIVGESEPGRGSASYNGYLVFGGTVNVDVLLPKPPVPMVYVWDGNVTIATGHTLTIPPRTVIKFDLSTLLTINGRLLASGTVLPADAPEPIVFTSLRDDSWWGDTNGDGASTAPAPGDWGSVVLNGIANSTVAGAIFHYGASSLLGQLHLVGTGLGTVSIQDCFFYVERASGGGIRLQNSSPRLQGCGFLGASSSFGVENLPGGAEVDATGNWWGSATGPNDDSPNTSCIAYANTGGGVRVTDCVRYDGWLSQPGQAPVTGAPPRPVGGVGAWAMRVQPNPARRHAEFQITGAPDVSGRMEVLDAMGRRIWSQELPASNEAQRTVSWDLIGVAGSPVAPGLYLARTRFGSETKTSRLLVVQ